MNFKSMNLKSMFAEFQQIREPEKTLPEKIEPINTFSEFENFKCPYCQESTVSVDDGSFVCTTCGKENGVVISDKQEWRSYTDSYDNIDTSRCGMPSNPLLPQSSLGTVATGNMKYAMPSHERARLDAIKWIKSAASKLDISGVLSDMACYLYVKLTENVKVKRGPVRRALMGNCQYAICKRKGTGCYVCPEKLSEAFEIKVKKFNEGSKLFAELSFYKTNCNDIKQNWDTKLTDSRLSFVKPTEPENIIRNVCEKLSFTEIDIASIIYITRNVKKLGVINSKMPQSIAAGCILLHVKEKGMKHIKINKISDFCTVSDATAKNTYNELKKYKPFLFPKKMDDLMSGGVGDCMPEIQLSKIYTAPKRALPPSIILDAEPKKINVTRGRPKKVTNQLIDKTN
jgi:transcription initiation factor TFIIIB Brf1 subunit/transcription initiation factor TFIIB